MFKYIESHIDCLAYTNKEVILVLIYICTQPAFNYSREINIYDDSLKNAVDFYCADQK